MWEEAMNAALGCGVPIASIVILAIIMELVKSVAPLLFSSKSKNGLSLRGRGSVELKRYDDLHDRGEFSLSARFMDEAKRKMIKQLAKSEGGGHLSSNMYIIVLLTVSYALSCFSMLIANTIAIEALKLLFLIFSLVLLLLVFPLMLLLLAGVSSFPGLFDKVKAFITHMTTKEKVRKASFPVVKRVALKNTYLLVDARSHDEYIKRTLRGAVEVEDSLEEFCESISRDASLFVFSNYGNRSFSLTSELSKQGMDAYDLGGVNEMFSSAEREAIELFYLSREGLLCPQVSLRPIA